MTEDTTETTTEAKETNNDVSYEIIDGDIDGVKVRGVRANGNVLFTVTESFSDDQIQEVFNLANKFFNDGINFGTNQVAARYMQFHQQMEALANPAPVQPPVETEGDT